jgi:diguanylate cyclase (GGDEF)-like protein
MIMDFEERYLKLLLSYIEDGDEQRLLELSTLIADHCVKMQIAPDNIADLHSQALQEALKDLSSARVRRVFLRSEEALLEVMSRYSSVFFDYLAQITDERERAKDLAETIESYKNKLERLHAVAQKLEALEEEEAVYTTTVRAAEEILDFTLCTLDIVEGNKLVVKATSSSLPPGASREMSLDEETLAVKTYHTGKTYIFGSLDEVPEARPTRQEFKSGISTPIGDIGIFQIVSTEPNAFSEDDVRLLELLLGHTIEAIKRIRLQKELKEQAIHDPLTGLYNRYYLLQALKQEAKRSKRYGHPIAFLMIDVNRFKEINDRFGHQMGDKVLQAVASLLLETVRETDIVVRYGGDEFLIILLETDDEAVAVKQRIIEKVASRNKMHELIGFPVTLSIGTAYWDPQGPKSVGEVLAEADKRMYDDKRRQAPEQPG